MTLSATITPISNVTTTQTSTTVSTITSTIISPAVTRKHTTTVTPKRVTVTRTITMGTVHKTKWTAVPTLTTKTVLQTCSVPHRQQRHDPWCKITPTLVSAAALSTETTSASSSANTPARRRDNARRVPSDRETRIAERKARMAAAGGLEKRGLDLATTTVTDQNSLDYPIVTSTITAAASTLFVTAEVTVTSSTTTKTTYEPLNYLLM